MKTLIIGSKGNLGSQLMNVFADASLVGWDREEVDATNRIEVTKKIVAARPDLIINASAYNAVDACEENEGYEAAKLLNGLAPGYIAAAAKQIGAGIIHYSTDYVFDGSRQEGYREIDTPNPISNYGRSKLLGEQEVARQGGSYCIIRTSRLFGPPIPGSNAKKSFIDIMLDLAEQKDEIDVVDEEVSCFTYAPDLAGATLRLAENFMAQKNEAQAAASGIYHLINEGPCTWCECAKRVFALAGKHVKVNPVPSGKFPRPAKRPPFSVLLNTKLPCLRNWDDAAAEYLAGRK